MTTDHVGPGSGVGRDYFYLPGDGFGFGYGLAVRTEPGRSKTAAAGFNRRTEMGQRQRHLFGVDPKLDMIYVLMAQTQNERARTRVVFKKLVYDAFAAGN
jgi:CubicO group peptidase (beta-lactamase class C family)